MGEQYFLHFAETGFSQVVTFELKDNTLSKIKPRFLTVVLEAKAMPSRFTMLLDNESLMCLGLSTMTSVLLEFNIKKL